jgi:CelD/BcsL family acetyltransferase involved in cellulose biosynthesis
MSTIAAEPKAKPAAAARHAAPPTGCRVVVVRDEAGLAAYAHAWDELARHALEPNSFLERWFLLPALRAFGAGKDLRFVLVLAPDRLRPFGDPLLVGLFALERRHGYKGLPVSYLTTWKHDYAYFGAPLLRREFAAEALTAVFDWLRDDADGTALLELVDSPGEGPFHQLLVDELRRRERPIFVEDCANRALFRPRADAVAYLHEAMPMKRRKEMERLRRRFAEAGQLELRSLDRTEDSDRFADDFLSLESQGWKGNAGTAMAAKEADHAFFRSLVRDGSAAGRVQILGYYLDDRPVALKCNFLAPPGSFAFKIAFAEDLSRYSPGVQMEVANIEHLHAQSELQWMDSCAAAEHFMINRLWLDRRVVRNVLIATGRQPGDLVVSVLPMLRWLRSKFRRNRPVTSPSEESPS